VAVTDAQSWTLLTMVGVLLGVVGGLLVNQFHLLRGYLDARFDGVDRRLDHLDRDVQALIRDRFGRD
jgi:hypothetical protein